MIAVNKNSNTDMFLNGAMELARSGGGVNSNHMQLTLNKHYTDHTNIPYNMIGKNMDSILTPTSPNCNSNALFLTTPFQASSYAYSTPSPALKPSPTHLHVKNEHISSDYSTIANTPTSIYSSTPCSALYTSDTTSTDGSIFKFEPEHIQRFQQSCQYEDSNLYNLDTDYFNYDEVNCQSKTQSPCSSPLIDPWMCYNNSLTTVNTGSTSPKQFNTQALPSMKIFSNQYQTHESMMSEYYDTSFLDGQAPTIASRGDYQTTDAHHPADNFNTMDAEKPNREFKNIWQRQPTVSSSPLANDMEKLSDCEDNAVIDDVAFQSSPLPLVEDLIVLGPRKCMWYDCYQVFSDQCKLVTHIEKLHVEQKKSDEFSCFWLDCVRKNKPFNARYKLLIHMRVHSGEKPNKCPVSVHLKVNIRNVVFMIYKPF